MFAFRDLLFNATCEFVIPAIDKIVIWLENNKALYPEGKSLPSALKCLSDLTSFKW